MDPRQPQHSFSRSNASPYTRAPFPPSSNTAPFPPASHPQQAQPQFPEHQRRTSDGQYYPPPRTYPQDGPPMSAPSHSRHPSSSSIGHGTPVPAHRQMPPPSSPQQTPHSYPPPISRGPPPSLGTPMSYSHGQNLPPISSHIPNLHRPPSTTGSSMSISALIGGPAPSSREPGAHPQYPAPPSSTSPAYSGPMQQSPRTHGADYPAYRKPQTPELPRPHELSGPRDHRANSAGSPPRGALLTSPVDTHRYGTPQSYSSHRTMPPQQGPPSTEDRREHYLARVPNPSAPPRPNSQPMAMNGPSPQMANVGRPDMPAYGRSNGIPEREAYMQAVDRDRAEREGVLREREREQREREIQIDRERMAQMQASQGQPYPHQQQHPRQQQQQQQFNRPPQEREQPQWMRPGYEQMPPDQRPQQQVPVSSAGYDYPRTTQAQYSSTPMYASDHRYPPTTQGPSQQGPPNARYEGPTQEEHRQQVQLQQQQEQQRQQQQQQQQQPMYNAPPGAYPQQNESPQRRPEEAQMQQQRNFLGPPQEINRKGRLSPLPQAVQGAQGQLSVPGGEPGIKSEFGRMFSGIGSGAGSAMPTPSPGNSQQPFSKPQLRREDLEAVTTQEQPKEGGRRWPSPVPGSRAGRRRKPKEEDKGDDDSVGRQTPTVRVAKRTKVAHHNSSTHQAQSNHHNHEPTDESTSQTLASFKSAKESNGSTAASQPSHSHHHHAPAPSTPLHAPEVTIQLPKRTITSAPVLASVSHLPRTHLGNGLYTSVLTPGGPPSPGNTHSGRGYTSMSNSIPRFEGKENCTFTVKVPRLYLEDEVRMEITSRRQVWGTDVYTDDSDVLAACIHGGWFRGAWAPDIDISLLGLEIEEEIQHEKKGRRKDKEAKKKVEPEDLFNLSAPPVRGPRDPPKDRDVELKILILPGLEKYTSTTRFGIKSRGWKEGHDGGSFMILSVRFVDGFGPAGTMSEKLNGMNGRGARRRERIRQWFEDGGDEFGDVGKVKWVRKKGDVLDERKKGTESEGSASTLKEIETPIDAAISVSAPLPAPPKGDDDIDGDVDMQESVEPIKAQPEAQIQKLDRDQEPFPKAGKEMKKAPDAATKIERKSPSPPKLIVPGLNGMGNGKAGVGDVDADGAPEPMSNGADEPEVLVRESNVRNE